MKEIGPSHCGVCAQNLPRRGLKNDDDVTLVPIFCAALAFMWAYIKGSNKIVVIKNGDQGDVNIVLLEFIEVEKPRNVQKRLGEIVCQIVEQ